MVDVELQLSLVLRKRRAHFDGIWVRYRLERAQRSGQPLDLRARMVACLLQCAARRIESSTLAHDALEQRSARGSLVGTRNHVPHGNAALLETKDLLRTREHGLVRRERSEERRVGKECRSRWRPEPQEKKARTDRAARAAACRG